MQQLALSGMHRANRTQKNFKPKHVVVAKVSQRLRFKCWLARAPSSSPMQVEAPQVWIQVLELFMSSYQLRLFEGGPAASHDDASHQCCEAIRSLKIVVLRR